MRRERIRYDALRRDIGRRAGGVLLSAAMIFTMMPAVAGVTDGGQDLTRVYAAVSAADSISADDITETLIF